MRGSIEAQVASRPRCTFNALARAAGCELLPSDPCVDNITLDSRDVSLNALFIAVSGENVDGRDFIDQAIAAGASVVVAEADGTKEGSLQYSEGVPILSVTELNQKVGLIAAQFFNHPSNRMAVIGVTGTNGKTTCAQLIQQMFQLLGEKAATIGTMGYGADLSSLTTTGLTTPDAISCQKILYTLAERNVKYTSLEVSSHAIVQKRHLGIQFRSAVFTNLSRDHLDYHGTMESYAAVKAELFQNPQLRYVVVNADDAVGHNISTAAVPLSVESIRYRVCTTKGVKPTSSVKNLVIAYDLTFSAEGIQGQVITPWGDGEFRSTLIGLFNVYNLLASISVACCEGYPLEKVLAATEKLAPIVGRMQKVEHGYSTIAVLIDYAHTPDALEQALMSAREHTSKALWVVFGCGGNRDRGKRASMGRAAISMADHIIVTSDNPRNENPMDIIGDIVADVATADNMYIEVDREKAIGLAVSNAKDGDLILIAGKGHETYQILKGETVSFSDYDTAVTALDNRMHGHAGVKR
ncbi:UDP-N-acetylmuramoyl-L-alanyl-D-glutamate--2,6-diaminopimelate ligase [Teredinibacter purpureus]|uniref:UDP-N-acetylmuramoyl-L-alanyl-D-glutamate--2, 6-diaminopimelate ligase n=1 Tax=Teredinibacter purpureus TaxID=2731756 RepID=UPI000695EB93|nr:UDP-N-acetylmuramoyl-L-alanyl-D-glutamate--2,6-diaminopimelate ligase [Teredinibacter purpureus]